MKLFEFVAPCSMFSFIENFRSEKVAPCEKSRLLENQLNADLKRELHNIAPGSIATKEMRKIFLMSKYVEKSQQSITSVKG